MTHEKVTSNFQTRDVTLGDVAIPPDRMRALRPEVVDALAESMAAQGLLQPIVLRTSETTGFCLIAGHDRLEAARKLGWEMILARIVEMKDADAARLAEIDENLIRADLSPAERAAHQAARKGVYERLHPETKRGAAGGAATKAKAGKANGQIGHKPSDRHTKDAAKKTGKPESTIRREAARGEAIPDVAQLAGTSLDKGEELDALARLPQPAQRELIARAKAGEKVTARHAAKLLRRKEREQELAAATEAAALALGKKRYSVLYVDPWKYNNPPMGDVARANENHYATMALDEIKALEVPAADSRLLFLWATIPLLDAAMEVLAAWGFKYKSAIVWEKDRAGTGYWVRGQVELLLIATRGKVPAPAPGEQFPALVKASRPKRHSEKPDCFAEMITRAFPTTPKLEMFARKPRDGWDSWGNEIESDEFSEAAE